MVRAILGMALSFIVLDTIWIRWVAIQWYRGVVGDLLTVRNGSVDALLLPAVLFYVVILFSLAWLVVLPTEKVSQAVINGAVAGLMSYATYALTCWALFRGWTWSLAMGDIAWGVLLCAVSCGIGVYCKS